jgi:SAM-dependent methyltransferase
MSEELVPDRILKLGVAYWGSKALLSAVELGLFSALAHGPLEAEALRERLGLAPRSARDFFDALAALGLLERDGDRYRNTPEADYFLDRAKPSYVGGWLEMNNDRLYRFWGALTEGLRTGQPQNETKAGEEFFGVLYQDPTRLRQFLQSMTGLSLATGRALAQRFPWNRYRTFVDVGSAQGGVPVQLALAHDHLTGGSFDLPVVEPIFREYVAAFGLSERLHFHPGDFFVDPLPAADVLVMGNILCDWNLDERRLLLTKAHAALPTGGALIVYDALIDDERRNAVGLLFSLNMLLETPGGAYYTGAECRAWMQEAGFAETYVQHLAGADFMVVATK